MAQRFQPVDKLLAEESLAGVRLSTRPTKLLQVRRKNSRTGCTVSCFAALYKAVLLKRYGFRSGLQLMVGLIL